MALPTTLPKTQGKYAVTAFNRGDVIHNGDIIWNNLPTREGFHTRFFTKQNGVCYCGPFETEKEALSVGLGFADFSGVILVAPAKATIGTGQGGHGYSKNDVQVILDAERDNIIRQL